MESAKKRIIIPLLIVAFLALAGVGIYIWFQCGTEADTGENRITVRLLNEGFTDVSVADAESAVRVAEETGQLLGYENALSGMIVTSEKTVFGNTYFRLQQSYKGIPVYGNEAVICATGDGTARSMTMQVEDISEAISITPVLSLEQASASAKSYFQDAAQIDIATSEDYIYLVKTDREYRLAYELQLSVTGDTFFAGHMFVDAETGEVILVEEMVNNLSVTAYTSDGSVEVNATWDELDACYYLHDDERGIYIYRFNDGDSSGKTWYGEKVLTTQICEDGTPDFGAGYDEALEYMQVLSWIYDYFYTTLDGENGSGTLNANYNDFYASGNNARGGFVDGEGYLSIGANVGFQYIDAIAHEYGHSIINSNVSIGGRMEVRFVKLLRM